MGPYIIGIITGYVLYKTECKVKINKVKKVIFRKHYIINH